MSCFVYAYLSTNYFDCLASACVCFTTKIPTGNVVIIFYHLYVLTFVLFSVDFIFYNKHGISFQTFICDLITCSQTIFILQRLLTSFAFSVRLLAHSC